MDIDHIMRQMSGRSVSRVARPEAGRLELLFTDGSVLVVERRPRGLNVALVSGDPPGAGVAKGAQPTPRQREYLAFITRYVAKFGRSPAESDIRRHFLVSAPTANRMMQVLERRGFITRRRGVPRSIRVLDRR